MASTTIFIPVPQNFSGIAAAGGGVVIQWTYTVPAGKRSVLEHTFVQVNGNANAANTTFANIQATITGTIVSVLRLNGSGVAATSFLSFQPYIDLQAGDTVQGFTINTGAAGVTMAISAVIREYG